MIERTTTKIYLFILIIVGLFWLGGSIYRAIVAYTLFEPFSLIVKSQLSYDILKQTLKLIGNINVYILFSYPLVLIFYYLFIRSSRVSLKKEGWLFMITMIFVLFFPVEIFLTYLDINYTYQVLLTEFNTNIALSLLIQRIGALGGLPAIALLCYLTSIWLAIFQPLRRN